MSTAANPMVWYGMVWYGMVWYGVVWCGVVWYGIRAPITTTPKSLRRFTRSGKSDGGVVVIGKSDGELCGVVVQTDFKL